MITGRLHAGDLAALAVQIADNVAHVALGDQHLDVHDRLEQDRFGIHHRLAHRHRTRELEGDVFAIDRVS